MAVETFSGSFGAPSLSRCAGSLRLAQDDKTLTVSVRNKDRETQKRRPCGAPSTSLGISPAGSDARKAAQLRDAFYIRSKKIKPYCCAPTAVFSAGALDVARWTKKL